MWTRSLLVVAVAACSGYPKPGRAVDADVTVDGNLSDAGPDAMQGTLPTAGTVTVTGTTDVGSTLTATPSGFTLGSPAGTYHYAWERCTTSACTSTTPIGSDSKTYVTVSGDGGSYIRCGITVTNSCPLGCGSSTVAYSPAVGAFKRVDFAKGGGCVVSGCSSGCNYYRVSIVGFSGGSHTVTCDASNQNNPWDTYTTSNFPSNVCCFGFPGVTAWVTVDGLRSNNVTW